jgi:glycosyltransferase involved in cell wall biosynthesis
MATKLFYGSSYDRGLEHLLQMWPKIKEAYKDAELHICYGWELFDAAYQNNPERMKWKEHMNKLMEHPGIIHHGRVGKDELKKIEQECDIWAYPTHFQETCCITAMDCQLHGTVPATIDLAALSETVQSGFKLKCDIYDQECKDKWLESILELMGDKKRLEEERKKGKEWAKQWSWEKVSRRWLDAI